jgi:hypothetical protein
MINSRTLHFTILMRHEKKAQPDQVISHLTAFLIKNLKFPQKAQEVDICPERTRDSQKARRGSDLAGGRRCQL